MEQLGPDVDIRLASLSIVFFSTCFIQPSHQPFKSLSAIEKKVSLFPHKLNFISINSMLFFPVSMSEGLFSAANIFSSLKLVYIFSVNPHLGPLQVSLSRMVMDIMKFFFLYVLVLFAFSSGLNQLLW